MNYQEDMLADLVVGIFTQAIKDETHARLYGKHDRNVRDFVNRKGLAFYLNCLNIDIETPRFKKLFWLACEVSYQKKLLEKNGN